MSPNFVTSEEKEAVRVRNELIAKWSRDTIDLFERKVKSDRPSDHLCVTTLSVCSTYSNAIMSVLACGLRMPAKALLRVLFEVVVKVRWCLLKREPNEPDSEVEERIRRWTKSSLKGDIQLREDYVNIVSGAEKTKLEKEIMESRNILADYDCKEMPPFYQVVGELSSSWQEELYPQLYRRFNDAVHLDIGSLCGKARGDGAKVLVVNDRDEPVDRLAGLCTAHLYLLSLVVREYYGWDTKKMQDEFAALRQLVNVDTTEKRAQCTSVQKKKAKTLPRRGRIKKKKVKRTKKRR